APNPYGDFTVTLLALDATVSVQGGLGSREVPIEEFLQSRERQAGTLVLSISCQKPGSAEAFRYRKIARIKPKGGSVITLAAHLPMSSGRDVAIFVDGGTNLLVALREQIGDMTPKFGCGQGGCGACSVLIDGELHLSCLTLAEAVAGRSVETLDGIKDGPNLHPLQRAFAENFAAQCGYCTPGMLMAAKALLDRNPSPGRAEIVEAISGNICRCTVYEPIIKAVL